MQRVRVSYEAPYMTDKGDPPPLAVFTMVGELIHNTSTGAMVRLGGTDSAVPPHFHWFPARCLRGIEVVHE